MGRYFQEMPYTKDGIVPDLILNPHSIPSRMTIGQLLESLLAKDCALNGRIANGTPFSAQENLELVMDRLEEAGYNRNGNEVLMNPLTGKRFASEIFIGPTFYQVSLL